jgi:hypothetical protein
VLPVGDRMAVEPLKGTFLTCLANVRGLYGRLDEHGGFGILFSMECIPLCQRGDILFTLE